LYLRGSEYFSTGDPKVFSKAESFFDRALQLDPQLAEAHVGLGAIHNAIYFGQMGPGERDLEISREHFNKALEINPGLIAALRGQLQIHLDRDESEECLKIARKAAAMGSNHIEALLLAGEAYEFGNMPQKAIPLLERAVRVDPASAAALWDLVIALQWTRQNPRAFQAGATYLERFGEDTEVYLWMGVAASAMGSNDRAAAMFDRAIETGGETRDLRTDEAAAWFYLQRGRRERAKEILSRMASALEERLAAYPNNGRVRSSLVEVYALLGRKADALHQLEILMPQISRPGYRDQAVPLVGAALLHAGCVEQAKAVFATLRHGDMAGSWGELRIYDFLAASLADQPEFQRFRAEGEAAMARLAAKYGS
jgi:tetratricopeptide (TPR) repeat protein